MNYLLLPMTALIFFSWYIAMGRFQGLACVERVNAMNLLSFAQIILTQFVLGISGFLYLEILIFLNCVISGILICDGLKRGKISAYINDDKEFFLSQRKVFLKIENLLLCALVVFAAVWIFCAGWLFPPRNVDELTYHLPQIFQAIQKHRFEILPVTLRSHFAFPFYGEFLFMWPAIFNHSQQFVDVVQMFVAFMTIPVVYGLARHMKVSRENSLFVGLLFFLTPIVLMQSGSCYIDVIVAFSYLLSLYFAVRFYRYQKPVDLYLAAFSLALFVGIKYIALILLLWFLPFLIPRSRKLVRHFVFCCLIVFVIGGYWYIRNFMLFAHPMISTGENVTMMPPLNQAGFVDIPESLKMLGQKWFKIHILDIELGRLNGGFGLIFWAFGLISWLYIFCRSVSRIKRRLMSSWFWFQLPVSFIFVLSWPMESIDYTVRYILYVVPIGLIAFGLYLDLLKRNRYLLHLANFKLLSIIYAFISVTLMAVSIWPRYNLVEIINSGPSRNAFHFLRRAPWWVGTNYFIWELVEDISVAHPRGLDIYFAASSDKDCYYVAPLYGLKLQNTIYNFEKNPSGMPSLCYLNYEESEIDGKLIFIGKKLGYSDLAKNPDYVLIFATRSKFVFLKKDILRGQQVSDAINTFYKNYPLYRKPLPYVHEFPTEQ